MWHVGLEQGKKSWLGADLVEKVDEAFKANYEVGILDYLDLL